VLVSIRKGEIQRMASSRLSSTVRRIAEQTAQRSTKARTNNASDGAELEMWWCRLAGLLQREMSGPRTWERLQEIARNIASGTYDEEFEGTTEVANKELDQTRKEE
jgi:hypothetical protein